MDLRMPLQWQSSPGALQSWKFDSPFLFKILGKSFQIGKQNSNHYGKHFCLSCSLWCFPSCGFAQCHFSRLRVQLKKLHDLVSEEIYWHNVFNGKSFSNVLLNNYHLWLERNLRHNQNCYYDSDYYNSVEADMRARMMGIDCILDNAHCRNLCENQG